MARNNDREDSLPAYYPGTVSFEVSVVSEPKDISNSDDYVFVAFRVRANGRNYKEQTWVQWYEVHVRGSAAEHVLNAGYVKNDRLVISGRMDASKYLPDGIREKDAEDEDWNQNNIISVDNQFGFCVPSNRFQIITIDEAEEEEERKPSKRSSSRSSRSGGGTKSRGRRDADEDEDEDDDDEPEGKPARRNSSSSRSSRAATNKGRASKDDDEDDDDDDEPDEKPARRTTRTSRNASRSERRTSRSAKSHGDDDDDDDDLDD